eukprot:COSAG02_NODE_10025_length_2045_cov_1.445529_1_plen_100_part_00
MHRPTHAFGFGLSESYGPLLLSLWRTRAGVACVVLPMVESMHWLCFINSTRCRDPVCAPAFCTVRLWCSPHSTNEQQQKFDFIVPLSCRHMALRSPWSP